MKIYLDDTRTPPDKSWTLIDNIDECKKHLLKGDVDEMTLDNDLGEGLPEGRQLVKWMVEENIWPKTKPKVHSANPVAHLYMQEMIDKYWPERNKKDEENSKT